MILVAAIFIIFHLFFFSIVNVSYRGSFPIIKVIYKLGLELCQAQFSFQLATHYAWFGFEL